jgi:formylglycine-generating enzyme required for sulfatase activity/serine/threonine protein kinase
MPEDPKPESTPRTPLQATLDTVASAGQSTERTAQGSGSPSASRSTTTEIAPELTGLQGYEIIRELGRGGMGVVYLARNKLINRPEVLKVMTKALVGRPEAVERFLREIRSAGQLIHANVATTFSAHQVGDLLVLAMEYVDGDDLAKIVRERGAMPVANACFCIHQAAMALQRGHELGMVHRDIKPSNILLAKQGKRPVVKVIDFGLAKAKSEVSTDRDLTGTNQMMGTPGYSAPEQLNDARTADTRSDIYALGCTLYCLLAGEPPFKGQSAHAVAMAQEARIVRPLREVRADVPETLAQVVERSMAHNPADRFEQPGEVAAALLPFIKGMKDSAESSDAVAAVGAEPRSPDASSQADLPTLPTAYEKKTQTGWGGIPRKRWPVAVLIGAAAAALIALAGTVIKLSVKSSEGDAILVVSVNQPNPDVFVDGQKVTVTWGAGGHQAEISVKPGTHQVQVKKAGFIADGETVTLSDGGTRVLTASLSRVPPAKGEFSKPSTIESAKTPSDSAAKTRVESLPRDAVRMCPQPLDCTGPDGIAPSVIRSAQEAWAKYLGRSVETNVEVAKGVTMTFVLVPPGKFLMGSPQDEKFREQNETLHQVTLTEPFDMGKYEVTQAQYEALTGNKPSSFKGPDRPVEQVTWNEATAFGGTLTKTRSDRHVYRLPTEAEWEYSCRAGRPSSKPYGIGDGHSLGTSAANFDNVVGETRKVGSYPANVLGLHDMHGNVWEWCADWNEPYADEPVTNPLCTTGGPFRVARGGCWNEPARGCRSALRQGSAEGRRDEYMGFRLSRSLPPAAK